ncbi:hypothetical protein HUN43_00056 [Streptomyces phage Endor1]|uniref:Uncharacterized protein n=1 Tax=Streptomyces phage Endor1 TaxID=2740181 RepID=A0A7G4AWX6_9CAUD|nr:hypothetical protein KGG92_gp56 [Streptomyces phage Endor1]QMP84516.1 hypothetical protein HUN43_00056 [Streptomyces phage Endor1]
MKTKTVDYRYCQCGLKRGFPSERAADKALGRAQAKRDRLAESRGTRRGLHRESRYYQCEYDLFHLTSESRRHFNDRLVAA